MSVALRSGEVGIQPDIGRLIARRRTCAEPDVDTIPGDCLVSLTTTRAQSQARSFYLAAEALALFVLLPGAVALEKIRINPILLLLAFTVLCLAVLLRDRSFDRRQMWRPRAIGIYWRTMLAVFLIGGVVISLGVWLLRPDLLFMLVKDSPRIWVLVLVLYPLFSVYPQELVYRAFFFHRYRELFRNRWVMIMTNAAAFSFMHIVFQNWVAVIMTFVGGLLFAHTYERTRSLTAVSLEHALYGCYIFTIGLGRYFYHGGVN
jgi:uncharacterized protein